MLIFLTLCWFSCQTIFFLNKLFHFSSWDSDHTGSTESDDDGKQLNTTDTQHIQ